MLREDMDHGVSQKIWNAAKQEASKVMIECARAKRTISYSDLVAQISSMTLAARDPRLFDMLGEISCDEDEKGRGLLTVVVVHKSGDMKPGVGFFELAEYLDRDTNDLLACWIEELNNVYDYWSS